MHNADGRTEAEVLESGALAVQALRFRLATQLAPRRWRQPLERLAQSLQAGQPLEDALKQVRLPGELKCLLEEGQRLPDPALLVLDALRAREEVRGRWQELVSLVAYPLVLLFVALFVGVVFSQIIRGLVDVSQVADFGLTGVDAAIANINDQHAALVGGAAVMAWMLIVLATIAWVGPPWAWTAIVGGMLVIGRPLRWVALQEILQRYYLFAKQGRLDSSAGHAVARSFRHSRQAVVALGIARRVDAGMPIGRAMATCLLADGLTRPALLLLDQPGSVPVAGFQEVARLLGQLSQQRCRVLGLILPVFLLAFVGMILWATISCYILVFFPLVSMLTSFA